jgi:hypothetical protein
MNTDDAVAQIDSLLARAGLGPGELKPWQTWEHQSDSWKASIMTAWLAGIERLTKPSSGYREQADRIKNMYSGHDASNVELLAGVLQALRADLAAGYVFELAALIHADVFGDFLEMADELLNKNYKDAAAVIVGSVLEEHLRKLAETANVLIEREGKPRKADTINADLTKAEVYNKIEQKAVVAWLGIRNDAAHAHYDNYTKEQVGLMLAGVRDFMIRHPA